MTVDSYTDVFKVQDQLRKQNGVTAHVVTMDSLRLYYYDNKIAEKQILSIVAACGKKGGNNILSIKRK